MRFAKPLQFDVFKVFHKLFTLSQIGSLLPIFISERLCLSKTSLFLANEVTDLMSVNFISC